MKKIFPKVRYFAPADRYRGEALQKEPVKKEVFRMDEAAFRIKLKQYKDTVYRIAYTYLQNTADRGHFAGDLSQVLPPGDTLSGRGQRKGVADPGDHQRLPRSAAVGVEQKPDGTPGESGRFL